MRKALILAYRFPPQGGGGVQRTLKYVKYLRQFGWQPVVHTVDNPYWTMWDQELLNEIPDDVRVYRTKTFEFERLESRLGSLLGKKETQSNTSSQSSSPPTSAKEPKKRRGGAVGAVREYIHKHILVPDPQIAWLPGAFVKSLLIARKEKIDLIYTSSPPNSSQVLGLLLKRMLGKPWVADFRDPWTDGVRRKQAYVNNPRRQRLEEGWERAIAERVDHFIVSTDKNGEQFATKHPMLKSKLSVLTNGFDPSDFGHLQSSKKFLQDGLFHLTLTGNVETMFDATPFLQAVKELIAENALARTSLRVNFVGTKRGKYDAYIQEHGLGTHINYIGYVPHSESVQYLADSDALFLCQIPEYESAGVKLPGKLFEYLYLRKPVLALTMPGVTTGILEHSGLGVIAHPNAVTEIKQALTQLLQHWQKPAGHFAPNDAFIAEFDRTRLAERLAQVFDAAVQPEAVRVGKGEHLEEAL